MDSIILSRSRVLQTSSTPLTPNSSLWTASVSRTMTIKTVQFFEIQGGWYMRSRHTHQFTHSTRVTASNQEHGMHWRWHQTHCTPASFYSTPGWHLGLMHVSLARRTSTIEFSLLAKQTSRRRCLLPA